MSVPSDYSELGQLIFACLNGQADADQIAQLEARLAGDEEARRYYGEFLVIYAGLRQSPTSLLGSAVGESEMPSEELEDLCTFGPFRGAIRDIERAKRRRSSEEFDNDLRPTSFSRQEAMREIESYARRQLEAFLDEQHREERPRRDEGFGWDLRDSLLVASHSVVRFFAAMFKVAKIGLTVAIIALVGLIVGLHIHANRVVATLTDSAEATWETPPADARLRPGWMRLEQGFALITFKRGAEVIVQAPCEFELRSSNAMFLEDGRMTARVPQRAIGFTVTTPTSRVVDFGTEFGVLTGAGRGDEVHVFDGNVRFRSARRRSTRWDQALEKGQAATVDTTGHVHVQELKDRPTQFVRALPDANQSGKPAGRLNVADIVAGGNGWGSASVGKGIDPSTGAVVSTYSVLKTTGRGFIETPSLAFVDGVFVPDGGNAPVVVSSIGTTFEGCPDTSGTCYRSIINGATFSAVPFDPHPGRLTDDNLTTTDPPSIGMHANAGITFDLEPIRRMTPQLSVAAFRALCGVSETVLDYANESSARGAQVNFWVLVDGQVRFSTTLTPLSSKSEWIDVRLSPEDRFLTLATTASGTCTFGWGMFAAPTLELETK